MDRLTRNCRLEYLNRHFVLVRGYYGEESRTVYPLQGVGTFYIEPSLPPAGISQDRIEIGTVDDRKCGEGYRWFNVFLNLEGTYRPQREPSIKKETYLEFNEVAFKDHKEASFYADILEREGYACNVDGNIIILDKLQAYPAKQLLEIKKNYYNNKGNGKKEPEYNVLGTYMEEQDEEDGYF